MKSKISGRQSGVDADNEAHRGSLRQADQQAGRQRRRRDRKNSTVNWAGTREKGKNRYIFIPLHQFTTERMALFRFRAHLIIEFKNNKKN